MLSNAIVCKKIEATRVQGLYCSECGARVRRVGLLPGGALDGLTAKCNKCGFFVRFDTVSQKKEGGTKR